MLPSQAQTSFLLTTTATTRQPEPQSVLAPQPPATKRHKHLAFLPTHGHCNQGKECIIYLPNCLSLCSSLPNLSCVAIPTFSPSFHRTSIKHKGTASVFTESYLVRPVQSVFSSYHSIYTHLSTTFFDVSSIVAKGQRLIAHAKVRHAFFPVVPSSLGLERRQDRSTTAARSCI